jgi:hypothetical protein
MDDREWCWRAVRYAADGLISTILAPMLLCYRRDVLVISVLAATIVACGPNDNAPGQAESKAPVDEVAANNEFWVEAPAAADEVRDYYTGTREEGLETVYTILVVTAKGASAAGPYELTEHKTNFGVGITVKKSRGNLTIEGIKGATSRYRLDGGGSPSEARIFEQQGDRLLRPGDPSLNYSGRAAKGRVELFELWGAPLARIRLRTDDLLVQRLFSDVTLKLSGTNPLHAPLRQVDASIDDKGHQLVTFKAVQSGSVDVMSAFSKDRDQQTSYAVSARVVVE